jgi:DNA-binding GntR family transcriptional regulator
MNKGENLARLIKGIDRSTTVDRVVVALRQAMFDGALNPGDLLREASLSKSLGVARSTIREVLRVLASEGLVTRLPSRGLAVRHLTMAEVEDIFSARLVLEREAARAAASCGEEALRALARAFDAYAGAASTGDPSRAAGAHVEFHAAMVGLIGSQRLVETERSLMRDLQLAIASIDKSSDDLPKEIEKHRVLCDLFTRRRVEEAIHGLEVDLMHAKAFVIRHAVDASAPPEVSAPCPRTGTPSSARS